MSASSVMKHLPLSLTIGRAVLGLMLLADAMDGKTGIWFAVGLAVGILSDIFDGILARRIGVDTPWLRELDSRIDVFFLVCIALSSWRAHADVIAAFSAPLLSMLLVYLLSLGIPWIKFRRLPSYHAYSAKLAGLALFFAALELFAYGEGGRLLWGAIIITLISHLDRIAITLLLPHWQPDVAGVWQAWTMRRESRP